MLLVIIGAGASFDSAISRPVPASERLEVAERNRPPLANELFQEREVFRTAAHNHPHFMPIVHRLRLLRGRGVEEVLEEIANESITYSRRKIQLLAIRYYIKAAIDACIGGWLRDVDESTNYRVLLDLIQQFKLDAEAVLLVTFNYDCLIENALTHEMGYKFARIGDYVASNRRFPLFKLHGSTDWVSLVRSKRAPYPDLIQHAETLQFLDAVVKEDEAVTSQEYSWGYVPAIAVPMQTKQAFECPKAHCDVLEAYLPRVTKILTVGWRGMEEHFIKMLNNHLNGVRSLMAVSKGDAGRTAAHLHSRFSNKAGEHIKLSSCDEGFSNFINEPQLLSRFLQE
jgi:SIR2-like domain